MKTLVLILLLVLCALCEAQSIDKISRRCPNGQYSGVFLAGNVTYTPCADNYSFFNNNVKLLDSSYAPSLNGGTNTNYFSIGTSTRLAIANSAGFVGEAFNFPLTVNGTSKVYVARQTWADVQGAPTSPTVIGHWVNVSSNSLFPVGGAGTLYGTLSNLDVGAQVTNAYGGWFAASSGGSGASGTANITGIAGVVNVAHNGNTTNSFGGDFWLNSSASSPSVVTLAAAVRARTTMQPGVTATTLRGVSISDWVMNGGAITNSVGLYIDTSIDVGGTTKFAIRSLSVSPSQFAGDLYVSDNAKGTILKSPNGNCWRIAVDNAGALSSASVTCPA